MTNQQQLSLRRQITDYLERAQSLAEKAGFVEHEDIQDCIRVQLDVMKELQK